MEFEEYKEKLVGRRFTDEQIEAAWRSRDRCDLCPKFLNDPCTGFVMTRDNGASEPKLLVIGEAPGGEEAQQGICFVGPAARHGKNLMEKAGVPMDQVRFTNAVKCLHDRALVYLADGSARFIGDLVREDFRGQVLSYRDGKIAPARVTAVHRSPLGERRWLKVSYVGAKRNRDGLSSGVIVTNDHQFLTCDDGWVPADQLDGRRFWLGGTGFGPRATSVMLGTLLGDSTVSKKSAAVSATHCEEQWEWATLKARVLGTELLPYRGTWRYRTRATRQIAQLREALYAAGSKQVSPVVLEGFDAQAAATLFMDDGCMRVYEGRRPAAQIAVCSFTRESAENICAAFKRLGVDCYARPNGSSPHMRIFFSADATPALVSLIDRFVPPSMEYKLGGLRVHPYDEALWDYEGAYPVAGEAVVEEAAEYYNRSKTAYCLSVEGTQNFLTPGGVAHNCFPHDENGSPQPPDERDAMACMPYLFDYIDEVRPKVLFTFGKVPTQLILGQSVAITKIAGNIFRTKIRGREYYVVPSIHPSADLRSGGKHAGNIMAAAARAWGLVDEKEVPVTTYCHNDTFEAAEYLRGLLQQYKDGKIDRVAFDIEFDTLLSEDRDEADRLGTLDLFDPEKHLVAVSFATSKEEGHCIPLDSVESQTDWRSLLPLIGEVVTTIPVVVHGFLKAEGPWVREKIGVIPKLKYDTMLMSYTLYMRSTTHGLKRRAAEELGWPDWSVEGDAWFNSQPPAKRTYRNLPMKYLGKYSAIDPAATWGLMEIYEPMITEAGDGIRVVPGTKPGEGGLWPTYYRRHNTTLTMFEIEYRGNLVDLDALASHRETYPEITKGALEEMRGFDIVKQYEARTGEPYNPNSSQQVADVVYGMFGAPVTAMNPEIRRTDKDFTYHYPGELKAGQTELDEFGLNFEKRSYWVGALSGEVGGERLEIGETKRTIKFKNPLIDDHKKPVPFTRGTPCTDDDQMVRALRESFCVKCGGRKVLKENEDDPGRPCDGCDATGKKAERAELFRFLTAHRLYKKAGKALNDYFNTVAEKLLPGTNKLTCNYIVHATQTARMSTKNMNVHSWPYHSDVRRLLVSKWKSEGGLIASLDESQIEMRVLASLTGDENFIRAYLLCSNKECGKLGTKSDGSKCKECGSKLGIDLHQSIAAVIYGKAEKDVLKEERAYAKAVAFGLVYGRGADSIADDTGMSLEEARRVIATFYERYPTVKQWVERQHALFDEEEYVYSAMGTKIFYKNAGARAQELIHKDGCTRCQEHDKTMWQHRRSCPICKKRDYSLKCEEQWELRQRGCPVLRDFRRKVSEGHRTAQNYPVQSPAAEVVLDALIGVHREMKERGLRSHPWQTTHDSIVFDIHPEELFEAVTLAKSFMEDRAQTANNDWLEVPLIVDVNLGTRWDGDLSVKSFDPDKRTLHVEGATEYYEETVAQLQMSYSVREEIVKRGKSKPPEEIISRKGYEGGSGRLDTVEAVLELL